MHGWRYASLTPERYGGLYFYSAFKSSFINHRSMPPASKLGSLEIGPKAQSGDLLKNDFIYFD
jgi:hypothetical protein